MFKKAIYLWLVLLLFLFVFLFCDLFEEAPNFAELKPINSFKNTEFLPTLEHTISKEKNAVYSASFLYAWDEIKLKFGKPLIVDPSSKDLPFINNSNSHKNTLLKGEYKTSIEVGKDFISAKAEFSKSLKFDEKMISFTDKLMFDNVKVASFGLQKYDAKIAKIIHILYYQDDNNFIVKLSAKDSSHEIVLFKTVDQTFNDLGQMIDEMNSRIEISSKAQNKENIWRYKFEELNRLVIPKINFNIENNYASLISERFHVLASMYYIRTAYQKTAFMLDENGAEVKSNSSFFAVKSVKPFNSNPKNLVFDKPFLLVLKRVDNKNPYFALWVCNAELMEKEVEMKQ